MDEIRQQDRVSSRTALELVPFQRRRMQLDRTFKTNIYGYFFMARAAVPHLGKGSATVNRGSVTAIQGSKELLDYSATQRAIHTFTKPLAQNLLEKGIRVNCVAPGPVWIPLNPADVAAEKVADISGDPAGSWR